MLDILKDFISINLKDYIDPGIDFPINVFLLSIALGLCIATFFITFHRRYTVRFIKKLLRHNALSEESAKSIPQLHIKPGFFLKGALSRSGQLTDMVKRVGETKIPYKQYVKMQKKKGFKDEKIDFENAKFYIAEEKIDRAKRISETPFPSYINATLCCILILAIFICIALFMPEILNWIAN